MNMKWRIGNTRVIEDQSAPTPEENTSELGGIICNLVRRPQWDQYWRLSMKKSGATFPWPRLSYLLFTPLLKLGQAPTRRAPVPNAYGATVTLKVLVTVAPAASVTRNWKNLGPTWPADGVQVNRPVVGLMVVGPNGAVPFG